MGTNGLKKFANKGIARNKSPLPNIIYKIELVKLKPEIQTDPVKLKEFEQYKFKDLGYLNLNWTNSPKNKRTNTYRWYWHGFITIDELKNLIGQKQYSKFCQGKRLFIIQRRVDGKNISLKK